MVAAATLSIGNPANYPWPATFGWINSNNIPVPMAAADMQAFGFAVGHYLSGCILRARGLKNALLAATTPSAVASIDIINGWPVS